MSIHTLASILKVQTVFRELNRKNLLVVAYHGIYDGPRQSNSLPPTFIHLDDFIRQVAFFRKHYNILNPKDFLEFMRKGRSFPPSSLLITFDDGYESYYRLAEPHLHSLGIKPIVFLPTRYVDEQLPFWFDFLWMLLGLTEARPYFANLLALPPSETNLSVSRDGFMDLFKRLNPKERDLSLQLARNTVRAEGLPRLFFPMSWRQINTAAQRGTLFGSHTHSHTILTALSEMEVANELTLSKHIIEENISQDCPLFAYPNGGPEDFGSRDKKLLADAGYEAAFSLKQQLVSKNMNLYDITRICVVPEDTVASLGLRCAMYTRPLARIIRTLKHVRFHGRLHALHAE